MGWEHIVQISQLCNHFKGVPAMHISYIFNHYKGESTLRLEREEEKEQLRCWAPPLQIEGPHDPQELRENGKQEVHHVGNQELGISSPGS